MFHFNNFEFIYIVNVTEFAKRGLIAYLHKIHLFILYLSLFLCGYTISVNFIEFRNFVYMMKFMIKQGKRVIKFERLKIRSNFTCR